jgi:hypothetical protein
LGKKDNKFPIQASGCENGTYKQQKHKEVSPAHYELVYLNSLNNAYHQLQH